MVWNANYRWFLLVVGACLPVLLPAHGVAQDRLAQPIVVPIPEASSYAVQRNLLYREREGRRLLMDVFTPKSGGPHHPGVIFVHGGPLPESVLPQGKDLGQLQSFGPFVTGAGLAGIVFSHGLSGVDSIQDAARDVEAAVRFVRVNADALGIDPDRLCMVFSSAGGIFLAPFLRARPRWLKCVVLNYAVLRPRVFEELREGLSVNQEQRAGLDPFPYVSPAGETTPSIFIAEAGRDAPAISADLQLLRDQALSAGWNVEYMNHPTGPHAFDVFDPSARSRAILMRMRDFLEQQLQSPGRGEMPNTGLDLTRETEGCGPFALQLTARGEHVARAGQTHIR